MEISHPGHHLNSLPSKTFVNSTNFHFYTNESNFSSFIKWTNGESRPENGSLLQVVTKDSITNMVAAE